LNAASAARLNQERSAMASELDDFIAFAERLASVNAENAMKYFQSAFAVEQKADNSPVTEADRTGEEIMRAMIRAAYPEHGIIGEEFPPERADSAFTWTLDPIDGTIAFVAGAPMFGTLIALLHDGEPILGVIDNPPLGHRWIGAAGRPTTFDGRPVKVRDCSSLEAATLSCSSPHYLKGAYREAFYRLADHVNMPAYGYFNYGYGLLAMGHVDIVIDGTMMPYDYLPLMPVLRGAGGVLTDWQGNERLEGLQSQIVAASSQELLDETLGFLTEVLDEQKARERHIGG
jgi:histidinol phosphatase-like enzyme (inositol monophosphatase family)